MNYSRIKDIINCNADVGKCWEVQLTSPVIQHYWNGMTYNYITSQVHPGVEVVESKINRRRTSVKVSKDLLNLEARDTEIPTISQITRYDVDLVMDFSHWTLLNNDEPTLQYLKSLGVTEDDIVKHRLGSSSVLDESNKHLFGAKIHPMIEKLVGTSSSTSGVIVPVSAKNNNYSYHYLNTSTPKILKWSSTVPMAIVDNWETAQSYDKIILVEDSIERIKLQRQLGYDGIISINNSIPSLIQVALIAKLILEGRSLVTIAHNDVPGLHCSFLLSNYLNLVSQEVKSIILNDTSMTISESLTGVDIETILNEPSWDEDDLLARLNYLIKLAPLSIEIGQDYKVNWSNPISLK
ncbi:hypothetical protein LIS04_25 [Listeria phage LIS04]|nr:hypothetical protein LIS04_25 [Listeria phage LIS04]